MKGFKSYSLNRQKHRWTDRQTHRHDRKHYLPTHVGGNNNLLNNGHGLKNVTCKQGFSCRLKFFDKPYCYVIDPHPPLCVQQCITVSFLVIGHPVADPGSRIFRGGMGCRLFYQKKTAMKLSKICSMGYWRNPWISRYYPSHENIDHQKRDGSTTVRHPLHHRFRVICFTFKTILCGIFTARQRSCGKVMFSANCTEPSPCRGPRP